jgi:glycosyltransferase 2 family protein
VRLSFLFSSDRTRPFKLIQAGKDRNGILLNKKQLIGGLIVLVALVALVIWGRTRIHFDFGVFRAQLSQANWYRISVAAACIYVGYIFRSVRWALLLRHNKKVPVFSLLGTQIIGFTAVALIGRIADPVRPYLVSRKTGLAVSNQIAVYIVERLFDFGSMGLIFSLAILLTAWFGSPDTLPHAELVKKTGYVGLVLTIMGALFLVAVRLTGKAIASFCEATLGVISKKLGQSIGNKIRAFHSGLDTIRSFSDFAVAASLSLGMWVLIALAYLETAQAFVASPPLAGMTPAKCVLLMVISGGASALQLPIIGWFTQIGIVAAAISSIFGAEPEAATACAATILAVTFLEIIPVGLIWAQFEHVSLRKLATESGQASQELVSEDPASENNKL